MKTFTYKVDILNIARYDLPKTFAPRTINPLIFTNFNEYTEYCESISKNIHRTHITLDEFGRVPMFQIMLDDQEIIGMSTDYVIDYEEPFIPNNDSYYLFTFIKEQKNIRSANCTPLFFIHSEAVRAIRPQSKTVKNRARSIKSFHRVFLFRFSLLKIWRWV